MLLALWKPVEGIEGFFDLEGAHDDYEGVRLLLKSEKSGRILRMHFASTLCYRNIDEGNYLSEGDGISAGFFKTKKSQFLNWFKNEGMGKWDDIDLIHYAIYTPNDCIDIISSVEPTVNWLN